jgi:Holliday junction resolvase RusA-like endonuclease
MREVLKFVVEGDPTAWCTPTFGTRLTKTGRKYRFAEKNPRLQTWQELVNLRARQAMSELKKKAPLLGPTGLRLDFTRQAPSEEAIGKPWVPEIGWSQNLQRWVKVGAGHNVPDLTNLFKGTEDALQEVCFGNDGQACFTWASRLYAATSGVTVTLYEL